MSDKPPSILIAEDEVLIADYLRTIVLDLGYEVAMIVYDLEEAKSYLESNQPDVAILNIQMNGKNDGIEIAHELNAQNIPFIFLTAFSDKVTVKNAAKLKPSGYLVKPIRKRELYSAIEIALESRVMEYITLRVGYTKVNIRKSEIDWIKSDNIYLEIHSGNQHYVVRSKMDAFLEQISDSDFIRVHRSYSVNKAKVTKLNSNGAMVGDHMIPVSKKYKASLNNEF